MNNQSIAHIHRLYRKFVGHVVAQSGLLAFMANTIVVPAGLITLTLGVAKGNLLSISIAVGVVAIIGLLLALISDGMTLSACARIRIACEKHLLHCEKYSQVPENEKTDAIRTMQQCENENHRAKLAMNAICIVFFGAISASAGTIFWHKLLESLPIWQSWSFSSLFALLITGTLVACEICKGANNEIVRESIVTDHFTNEALLEDANEHALQLLHRKYRTKIEAMGNETDTIAIAIEEHAQRVYDNLLADGKGIIPARIRREKADKEIAMRQEQIETGRQLRLIKGGKDAEPCIDVDISSASAQSSSQKIAVIYERFGEKYIKENIDDVSKDLCISKSTVYRHLSRMKDSAS